jgi:hypothetical protein
MGSQVVGWSKPAIDELKKHYKDFKLQGTFTDRFQIKEIFYDKRFTDYWNRHDQIVKELALLKVGGLGGKSFVKAMVALAKKVPKGKLRTHAGDVFLYAATLLNEPVTLDIDVLIATELKRLGFPTYSIIAHSLGTRVIHDVLQRSFTDRADSYMLRAKPRVLMSVSNVTKLMSFKSGELKREKGLVVFPSDTSTKGVCQHYINVNHPLDPFAVIRKYTPEFSGESNYWEPEIDSSDITSKEVHSLKHYCEHPAVAAEFLNQVIAPDIIDSDPISSGAVKASLIKYREKTLSGNLENLRGDLKNMKLDGFSDWKSALKKINKYMDYVEAFR